METLEIWYYSNTLSDQSDLLNALKTSYPRYKKHMERNQKLA